LVSSVMSPMAALTTATLPFSAPARERNRIIVQKFSARPLIDQLSYESVIAGMSDGSSAG
jgi:hypothetical protein